MAQISRVRYEHHDEHFSLFVIDVFPERHRRLQFDDSIQGVLALDQHQVPVLEYIGLMDGLGANLVPLPDRILIAGLGVASLYHAAQARWGTQTPIQVVERYDQVLEVAKRFFRFPDHGQVTLGDIRDFLEAEASHFSLIHMDCYDAEQIPDHIVTRGFAQLVRTSLTEDGVAIFNLWHPEHYPEVRNHLWTLLTVFTHVQLVASRSDANVIVAVGPGLRNESSMRLEWKDRGFSVRQLLFDQPRTWPGFLQGARLLDDEPELE